MTTGSPSEWAEPETDRTEAGGSLDGSRFILNSITRTFNVSEETSRAELTRSISRKFNVTLGEGFKRCNDIDQYGLGDISRSDKVKAIHRFSVDTTRNSSLFQNYLKYHKTYSSTKQTIWDNITSSGTSSAGSSAAALDSHDGAELMLHRWEAASEEAEQTDSLNWECLWTTKSLCSSCCWIITINHVACFPTSRPSGCEAFHCSVWRQQDNVQPAAGNTVVSEQCCDWLRGDLLITTLSDLLLHQSGDIHSLRASHWLLRSAPEREKRWTVRNQVNTTPKGCDDTCNICHLLKFSFTILLCFNEFIYIYRYIHDMICESSSLVSLNFTFLKCVSKINGTFDATLLNKICHMYHIVQIGWSFWKESSSSGGD